MKLIEAYQAKEFASTFLADKILQAAVNAVVDNCPSIDVVYCHECKYFLRHTQVDTDRGDCACYGITACRVKHVSDYCSKGRREEVEID